MIWEDFGTRLSERHEQLAGPGAEPRKIFEIRAFAIKYVHLFQMYVFIWVSQGVVLFHFIKYREEPV